MEFKIYDNVYQINEELTVDELLSNENIIKAASILKNGGTVVFPTETVYGIGADALKSSSAIKVYNAKGRPSDNPLIVHISDLNMLEKVAKNIDNATKILIDTFFPGPLTIIMQKGDLIPYEVTASLDTVGVRMPRNNVALALIKSAGVPVCAPSANISGKPSGTSAIHVCEDLAGRVDIVLAAKNSKIGIESTIIDMSKKVATILRPGAISIDMIREVFKFYGIKKEVLNAKDASDSNKFICTTPIAPGMKYRHYKPNALVYTYDLSIDKRKLIEFSKTLGKKIYYINEINPEKLAKNLFYEFRIADEEGYDVILVPQLEGGGIIDAINNRLNKASVRHFSKEDI